VQVAQVVRQQQVRQAAVEPPVQHLPSLPAA
jgi:hypothetical protein